MFYRIAIVVFCGIFSQLAIADGEPGLGRAGTLTDSLNLEQPGTQRSFELYASDKAAQGRYDRDASRFKVKNGRMNGAFLFTEERDIVFSGGVTVGAEPDFLKGFLFSVGTRAYAALLSTENSDAIGIAVGLEGRYTLPLKKFPLQFELSFYYAPDIFTFGQSDRVIDAQTRVGLAITESMDAFVGVRVLQFDTRPGSVEVDDQVHLGVRWALD